MGDNANRFYDRFVIWRKPILPFVKLNSNGSVRNSNARAGGIIRDYQGVVLAAFASPLHPCSVLTTELYRLSYGIDICNKLGFVNVWIEVDAHLIIQILNNQGLVNHHNFYLLRKIKKSLSNINYTISHIFREDNACVDWLSNLGCHIDDYQDLNISNLDPILKGMINLDKIALPYIRHV
ncbi:uncharacterized protein LOC110097117 [Dendrobium catenatum]|uniref:uncharacterized protein LOC110097117 n=1 Tax=Dendrobium catenatum TaxID=906689 RepID=UPI0009F636B1|nr:uncharacterized protein LOC110097117 [Dendrobium catenatum]